MKHRFLLLILLLLPFTGLQAGIPAPPSPPRLVNDFAGIFSPQEREGLEEELVAFDDSTSNQICVVTVKTLDGMEVVDYAVRLGNSWGIGSHRNNGILILLKARSEEESWIDVTIQIGKGLEGAIPDVYASRIIRNIMGPCLKDGKDQYFTATQLACEELMKLASGEISEPRDGGGEEEDWVANLFATLIIILIMLFIFRRMAKAFTGGGSSGGSSGGGFFGGGWSSGGGSSSGGGWSSGGSSRGGFGGFGGGSFGGGGASGRF